MQSSSGHGATGHGIARLFDTATIIQGCCAANHFTLRFFFTFLLMRAAVLDDLIILVFG